MGWTKLGASSYLEGLVDVGCRAIWNPFHTKDKSRLALGHVDIFTVGDCHRKSLDKDVNDLSLSP